PFPLKGLKVFEVSAERLFELFRNCCSKLCGNCVRGLPEPTTDTKHGREDGLANVIFCPDFSDIFSLEQPLFLQTKRFHLTHGDGVQSSDFKKVLGHVIGYIENFTHDLLSPGLTFDASIHRAYFQ
ncbi:MAG: hypothetical protein UMU76_08205, partial [Prosthecochloris sp.]|nr:hypothetical protein [Prosthecochloris sp.]